MDLTVADLEAVASYAREGAAEEQAANIEEAARLIHKHAHAVVELVNRLEASWTPAREVR